MLEVEVTYRTCRSAPRSWRGSRDWGATLAADRIDVDLYFNATRPRPEGHRRGVPRCAASARTNCLTYKGPKLRRRNQDAAPRSRSPLADGAMPPPTWSDAARPGYRPVVVVRKAAAGLPFRPRRLRAGGLLRRRGAASAQFVELEIIAPEEQYEAREGGASRSGRRTRADREGNAVVLSGMVARNAAGKRIVMTPVVTTIAEVRARRRRRPPRREDRSASCRRWARCTRGTRRSSAPPAPRPGSSSCRSSSTRRSSARTRTSPTTRERSKPISSCARTPGRT